VTERLAVTLRSLATGDSYHSRMYLFKVPSQPVSLIIPLIDTDTGLQFVTLEAQRKLSDFADRRRDSDGKVEHLTRPNCIVAKMFHKFCTIDADCRNAQSFYFASVWYVPGLTTVTEITVTGAASSRMKICFCEDCTVHFGILKLAG
jgi:hypothetical protein